MAYKSIFVSGSMAYDRIMDFQGKFSDHILPGKVHTLNISFVVKTLGSFTISDISGKTATGTYSVGNSALTLQITASTLTTYPVGTKTYPIAKIDRQDLVLNIP